MSSNVGYSQVADYSGMPGQMNGMPGQMNGMPGQMNGMPGQMNGMNQSMQGMQGNQAPQPHAEFSSDTVIYKGGPPPPPPAASRGPLPTLEDEFPPPPPMRSADTSLNDSNSTTQSNLTSECSEAECDMTQPLVNDSRAGSIDPSRELTTEEMRKLIERNEVVQRDQKIKPYNTVDV